MFLGLAAIVIALSRYEKSPPVEPVVKTRYFGTTVTPMDYEKSDTFVRPVYVDGGWVGAAGTGGSSVGGALSLPAPWHPGLTVRVKWRRCEPYGKTPSLTQRPVTGLKNMYWFTRTINPVALTCTSWKTMMY
ncbi:MAG: DUF3304 domain-containing protein [Pseudomonas sp.]|uniref:DUF3304 domain-containing protein n=1 Tax=Pseudomonas sp. TaxID=306 RepID=UPI0023A4D39B|nr:DUF3304 domain-containing protein [Pseudomonas sp.]MDE1198941.1 DUF3304 domain-containing protein [Pseudomonas sp.]